MMITSKSPENEHDEIMSVLNISQFIFEKKLGDVKCVISIMIAKREKYIKCCLGKTLNRFPFSVNVKIFRQHTVASTLITT